jgi:hypothetical protein
MDFTLDQLLTVIGRLEDTPGFDTPRERFRRFLNERLNGFDSARQVIQYCREHSGEQSHRALQDALALSGRLLGFDTTFGRYQPDAGVPPVHGTWQSRRRLRVTLLVCSDQTKDLDLDAVTQTLADGEAGIPRVALLVVTPLYAGKERLEQSLAAGKHPQVRLITLRGFLRLGGMVAEGHLSHEDVVQLLNPAVTLDSRLDLLERVASAARREPAADQITPQVAEPDRHERRYWVNALRPDPFTPTERIVGSLIATRQILGINPAPGLEDRVRVGDGICVFIAGRGIVAHAQVAGILTDGSRMIRDSKRFTHVLRLTDVAVYDVPVVPSQELVRKLDLALTEDVAAVTAAIARREFESITAHALSQAG